MEDFPLIFGLESFKKNGVLIIRNVIDVKPFYDVIMTASKEKPWNNDDQVPNTPSFYSLQGMDDLHEKILPIMEKHTGLKLFKTYSYCRVYKNGDILASHVDRPSCEISVTLCLGHGEGETWPIFIRDKNDDKVEAKLEAGDALIYRGCDLSHWRYPFEGEHQAQIFLHYVDQNGPYAEWKDDKKGINNPKNDL